MTDTPSRPETTATIVRELRERVVGHPRLMTAAADEIERLRAIIVGMWVDQSDYPGEAAKYVAAALRIPFRDALAMVEKEIEGAV